VQLQANYPDLSLDSGHQFTSGAVEVCPDGPCTTDFAEAHMATRDSVEALPPVIVYAALNPGVPVRETSVAPMLNAGLTAAEAAGVTGPIAETNGWNWGTKAAAAMAPLLIAFNLLSAHFLPGWLETLPQWAVYVYLFGLVPAFALAGFVTARIRRGRYRRWLLRAQEVGAEYGDRLVYMGDVEGENLELTSALIQRVLKARKALLSGRAVAGESEAKVLAALSTLAEYLTHPVPQPLPSTAGMLFSAIRELEDRQTETAESLREASRRMLAALDDLEFLAGTARGSRAGMAAGHR
jgi:signal transduction histidine kinase